MPDDEKYDPLLQGVKGVVSTTEATADDRIEALKTELDAERDAREQLEEDNTGLRARNSILEDQGTIKQSAFNFSRWFLIIIPMICLALFLATGLEIKKAWTSEAGVYNVIEFGFSVYPVTQAVLISVPILFVAAILVTLFRSVSTRERDETELNPNAITTLANIAKYIGGSPSS